MTMAGSFGRCDPVCGARGIDRATGSVDVEFDDGLASMAVSADEDDDGGGARRSVREVVAVRC
jgi:hypothetical protein